MNREITYRQVLTAIFLLVYAFITTPVQFWHHHNVSSSKSAVLKISADTNADVQGESCKICDHIYTAYLTEKACFNFGISNTDVLVKSFFQKAYSSIYLNNLSNKSPPVA